MSHTVDDGLGNLLATPWRFLAVVVLIAVTVGWPAYREANLVRSLQDLKRAQVAEGRFVAVVVPGGPAAGPGVVRAISGAACDALADYPGIRAAGVASPAGSAVIATAPSGGYALWHVSPGMLRVLGTSSLGERVLVGSVAAQELGLRDGDRIAFRQPASPGSSPVTVVAASGPRTAAVDRAILTVSPPAAVAGDCFVETDGIGANSVAEFAGALLGGLDVNVLPLASQNHLGPDPVSAYASQQMAFLSLTAPLLAILAWCLLLRSRRSEITLARIAGASRTVACAYLMVEFAGCCALATAVVAAAVAAGGWGDGLATSAGIAAATQGYAIMLAAAVPVTFLCTVRKGGELQALRGAE